jgi:O-methyltransferase involved in polyketide biosynthesis
MDPYAYCSTLRDRLRIFEVDHPSTQACKRQRLEDAAIPIPGSLTFAPVDFECQALTEGLAAADFDPAQQTFFTWLGVERVKKVETIHPSCPPADQSHPL